MIYLFTKELSYEYVCQIEANSLQEALDKLEDKEWYESSEGEPLIRDRKIQVYEDYDAMDDDNYIEYMSEDNMRDKDIWFD